MNELNYLSRYPWFHSIGKTKDGRIVVYVTKMNSEVLHAVPNNIYENQVLLHFVSFKDFDPNKMANYIYTTTQVEQKPDLKQLVDKLKSESSPGLVQDIFYEIHDGDNAITDESWKHPKIRLALEQLYGEFGFDSVYDQLEY
jgi:hypothetical protein